MIYTAANGDTWDSIAYKVYNDEFQFVQIMEANRNFSDVVVFSGGESVYIPDEIITENTIIATPWQEGATIRIITPAWR